jgi:site-specific DNA-cytosine methylase
MPLGMAVDLRASWPTPIVHDATETKARQGGKWHGARNPGSQSLATRAATWPTPTATDGTRDGRSERNGIPQAVLDSPTPVAGHNLGLSHAARLWPTPTKSDGERGPDFAKAERGSGGDSLVTVAAAGPRPEPDPGETLWRTPTSTDWKGLSAKSWRERAPGEGDATPRLADQVDARDGAAGALAPEWVEWLMGFPLGWTDPTVDDAELEPWGWETDPAEVGRTSRLTTDPTLRKERLKALGNAVVPACAELIGRELMARWEASQESD